MKLEDIKKGLKHTAKLTAKNEKYYELMCDSIDNYINGIENSNKLAESKAFDKGFAHCKNIVSNIIPEINEKAVNWDLPF